MTEEWVSLWVQCLKGNLDYAEYCEARKAGDQLKSAELEGQFEKIAGIYEDFGSIDHWPEDGMQSKTWRDWFRARRHLFLIETSLVTDPDQYALREGYILLEVPLQADVRATLEAVADKIEGWRELEGTLAAPKYALNLVDRRPAHGIQQVRQACRSVARSYRYDPETFEELRHVDAIAAFVRHEIDNMGWTLDPQARDELDRTGRLSEQRLESFKVMLNRCRRDYRAFAANTIRASFPDDRPFESNVLDIH